MRTAVEAVGHNKLRAMLTSLGILFGVASVIAMLAIGRGAEQEILEQMRLLGSNNVIITPIEEQKEEKAKDQGIKEPRKYSPGLTWLDAEAIRRVVPGVEATSGEIVLNTLITREGRRRSGKVVGIDTTYFRLSNLAPDEPATGFGYIERGAALGKDQQSFAVARFVEKPDLNHARQFLASGKFFWNSGMFVFKASVYLNELQRYRPDIYQAAQQAWQRSTIDMDFCRLDEQTFAACPSDSIDYAVMERTQSAAMVTVDIGWSDIGSWSSLDQVSAKDTQGNALRGDVYAAETTHSFVRAESRMVAAIGVQNLVIVETADAVLVMHKDFAQDVKHAVEYLKQAERTEHLVHRRVYRPWGYYEGIDVGERFQAKRIMVKPGAKLSLQMHHHRAEHWVVVSGKAKVTRGEETMLLHEDQSTYIPIGMKHRLENVGAEPLYLIEVQSGSYLGEDDIVRFDDVYKRS